MRRKKTAGNTKSESISRVLTEWEKGLTKPNIRFGELRDQFSNRFYGFLLFILALPNLVPVPAPGLSAVMGIPLVLLTFQMMLGLETPWFPAFVTNRKLKAASLKRICKRAVPVLQRMERLIKPRASLLVQPPADRVIALLCLLLSLVLMLPIPFGNALPGLAICFFAIALLQRDGVFAVLGCVVGVTAMVVVAASVDAAMDVVQGWFDV